MLSRQTIVLAAGVAGAVASSAGVKATFDWTAIEPTPDLRYHPCYDGFQCARLKVPMDWNDPENNKTVAIAITALPAEVPIDHPDHGGTILTNPGGPGGSGVSFVQRLGPLLRRVTSGGSKKYEILSFDPRGVQFTTPHVDCFDDVFGRDSWLLEMRGLGSLGSSKDGLRRSLALYEAFGQLCENTLGDSEILHHVSTASVSRDMIEIIDRIEELKKKTKEQNAVERTDQGAQHPMGHAEESHSSVARLQYIGFSYGTVLGNTFASMYPGRVGRVVLDGVVDIHDYMNGTWARNLMDTEAIVDYFYDECFNAGDRCALRKPSDNSSADIKGRVNKFIADADASPISYVRDKNIVAVTGDDIRLAFFPAVYNSFRSFPPLAQLISDTLEGNYTLLLKNAAIPALKQACSTNPSGVSLGEDASSAIACTDGDDLVKRDYGYYEKVIDYLKNQSDMVGSKWATIWLSCYGRQVRTKWRFPGPWVTPPADKTLKEGVPAAPLLLLTSRLDPVTPAVNADLMSAGHPGSAVVIQESVGHCAIATGWSECTNKILQDYFNDGVVPKNGTVCDATCKPWQVEHCEMNLLGANALGGEDLDTWFNGRLPLGL